VKRWYRRREEVGGRFGVARVKVPGQGAFGSGGERDRGGELELLARDSAKRSRRPRPGDIRSLVRHQKWHLYVGGVWIMDWEDDYNYEERTRDGRWELVVEDWKDGIIAERFLIARRLMEGVHGIRVRISGPEGQRQAKHRLARELGIPARRRTEAR
jgi:hypothetical protein